MTTGQEIKLNEVEYYKSSKSIEPIGKLNGTYFFWNDTPLNGRIRVSELKEECGIKDCYIGWINIINTGEKPILPKNRSHENEHLVEEVISYNNSLLSICWKHFNSYSNLLQIVTDNDLDSIIPDFNTKIKVWIPDKAEKFATAAPKVTNPKTVVAICGQDSTGKSTYINKFLDSYEERNNAIVISMDNIVYRYLDDNLNDKDRVQIFKDVLEPIFYDKILTASSNANSKLIITDYAQTRTDSRKEIVNHIKNKSNVNFICVMLNPKVEEIVKRQILRGNSNILQDKKSMINILRINKNIELPTDEEFANYGFKSVKTFIIDNSDDIDKLDMKYLIDYIDSLK